MFVKVYSVYDSKAEAYLAPQYFQTKGVAIRAFVDAVNEKDSPFNKYPEDYTMFEMGDFDDKSGSFALYATPISIGKAIEFVKS